MDDLDYDIFCNDIPEIQATVTDHRRQLRRRSIQRQCKDWKQEQSGVLIIKNLISNKKYSKYFSSIPYFVRFFKTYCCILHLLLLLIYLFIVSNIYFNYI